MKDAAYSLVDFLSQLRYEHIPAQALEMVRLDVLDYFGNTLGGSSDSAIQSCLDIMCSMGGAGQCPVIGHGAKLPAPDAAFINAAQGFCLDYDDTHEGANTHLGVACIPAALATAELVGGTDGKTFLTAVTGGMELAARLGIGCRRKIPTHIMGGWDYAALHGIFSAAAAAGLIFGLTRKQLLQMMGIAYQQAGGNTLSAIEEADTKKLGPGFAARGGVLSALLARAGVTGCRSVFTGTPFSLFPMYHDGGDASRVTEELGTRFVVEELGFKPYPCCRLGHRQVDAVLVMRKEYGLRPEDIKQVELHVCPQVDTQLCQPRESKLEPKSRNAAQFSLPWMIACALVRGRVGIGEFLPKTLTDPELRTMAARVKTVRDDRLSNETIPAQIVIETEQGRLCRMTQAPYGSRENPMNALALEEKFRDNLSYAARPLERAAADTLLEGLRQLPELTDVRFLTAWANGML